MSELKDYWDKIDSSSVDSASIEEGVHDVVGRIRKQRTIQRSILATIGALPIFAICLFLFRPADTPAQTLQCYSPYGQRQTLTLADGSTVTLNSGSTLVYSDNYTKGTREVVLIGEAKFEVAKNPKQPFVVKTKDFDVQVLGTVFDVNAYPENETASVTLASGSVKILRDEEELLLTPGQMASLGKDNTFRVKEVDTTKELLWITGGFAFRQASITDICSYIEHTYGMSVQCNTLLPKYKETSITARRDSELPLDELLSLCSNLIPGMKYNIENNIITFN